MNRRKVIYNQSDPYSKPVTSRVGYLFCPDEYRLSLIMQTLTPIALRMLVYCVSQMDAERIVFVDAVAVGKHYRLNPTYINKGVTELVRYNFMARHTFQTWFINPDVAYAVLLPTI